MQVDTGSPARLSCQAMAMHRQQKQKKKASMHDHGRDLCVPTRLRKQLWAAHKFFQSKHACKAMGNAHHGKPAEPPTCGQLATKVHRVQAYLELGRREWWVGVQSPCCHMQDGLLACWPRPVCLGHWSPRTKWYLQEMAMPMSLAGRHRLTCKAKLPSNGNA